MKSSLALLFALSVSAFAANEDATKFAFEATVQKKSGHGKQPDAIRRWNKIAIDATGYDHAGPRQQMGPGRASRALAIVHTAIFDVVNAVKGDYESYTGILAAKRPISTDIAVSQAAHDTLVALFPAQAASFDAWLAKDLDGTKIKKEQANGSDLGKRAATAILALKANDGAEIPEPLMGVGYIPSSLPGHWRQDPISLIPLALGAHWGECVPFVLEAGSQFRAPLHPAIGTPEYAAAYDEVKRLGGDGVSTPTERTPEQTVIGIFWAYDGTPSLGVPPRLYNQITTTIADQMGTDDLELARLLALVNVSMADAGMAVWDSKYFYDLWRPIGGIRESDPSSAGPGDGNAATVGDSNWKPLGAQASNLTGPNFTPPFPAYPSGHAGFGGALFQTLRRFYGTDRIPFTFVSDEFNGVTKDNNGNVRPYLPRTFNSLSQAEEENGQSRIYLGIHWSFDKTVGIAQGRLVADYVFDNAFKPRRHRHGSDASP